MEDTLLIDEIKDLKKSFEETGINCFIYFSKKRLLRARIDYEIEKRLHLATCNLVFGTIDKVQYNHYKRRLEQTREQYKYLLSQA